MNKSINLTDDLVISKIYFVRGKKIMLDRDLAEMYGVETKNLKRQVKRNSTRFPNDFMFELSLEELYNLRCQIGTSSNPPQASKTEVSGFPIRARGLRKVCNRGFRGLGKDFLNLIESFKNFLNIKTGRINHLMCTSQK